MLLLHAVERMHSAKINKLFIRITFTRLMVITATFHLWRFSSRNWAKELGWPTYSCGTIVTRLAT